MRVLDTKSSQNSSQNPIQIKIFIVQNKEDIKNKYKQIISLRFCERFCGNFASKIRTQKLKTQKLKNTKQLINN